jgi:hypothetical protein
LRIRGKTASLRRPSSTIVSRRCRPTVIRHRCATLTNRGRSSLARVSHLDLKTVPMARSGHAWDRTIGVAICAGFPPWLSSPQSLQYPSAMAMTTEQTLKSRFASPDDRRAGGAALVWRFGVRTAVGYFSFKSRVGPTKFPRRELTPKT